jgi:hypothetical protein
MEDQLMWAIKPALFVLGGLMGGIAFLAAGELIHPTAKAETLLPSGQGSSMAPSNPPPVNGTNNSGAINAPNNSGIITQGQVGNNTINVGRTGRRLSQIQIAKLSAAMAHSGASGVVEVQTDLMGCPDCDGFAKQFETVLSAAPGLRVCPETSLGPA